MQSNGLCFGQNPFDENEYFFIEIILQSGVSQRRMAPPHQFLGDLPALRTYTRSGSSSLRAPFL